MSYFCRRRGFILWFHNPIGKFDSFSFVFLSLAGFWTKASGVADLRMRRRLWWNHIRLHPYASVAQIDLIFYYFVGCWLWTKDGKSDRTVYTNYMVKYPCEEASVEQAPLTPLCQVQCPRIPDATLGADNLRSFWTTA